LISDRNDVSGVVDDDGIVDVVVDDVVRRRCDVLWGPDPHRDRRVVWNRKHKRIDRRRRRRKIDKIHRPGRQKDDGRRRWRSKTEVRIVEYQHPPFNVNDLLRWRRRHIVGDHRKPRRWLESG
jgi:hypothetical protein